MRLSQIVQHVATIHPCKFHFTFYFYNLTLTLNKSRSVAVSSRLQVVNGNTHNQYHIAAVEEKREMKLSHNNPHTLTTQLSKSYFTFLFQKIYIY